MSLINEALKKAQRQRTENPVSVPAPPVESSESPAPRIVKRRPPMPARTLTLLLSGGFALLLMGGVLGFVLLSTDTPTPPPPASPVVVVQPVAPPATPPPTPEPVAPPVKEVVITPAPVDPVAPAPVDPPAPTVPTRPTADPEVYKFLETVRISGIRPSSTDPKVIMNERVFRLNDIVDRDTQLRLTGIDSTSLTFVDPSGFEYRKSF